MTAVYLSLFNLEDKSVKSGILYTLDSFVVMATEFSLSFSNPDLEKRDAECSSFPIPKMMK